MQRYLRSQLAAAVWLIPLGLWAFALYFTSKYASNVPYWDAWEYAELVAGVRPLTWGALWEQHNEHRIVWQTLFEVAWGRWARWDQYWASFAPMLVLGAGYCYLVVRAVRARPHLTPLQRALLVGALSPMLFTFRQYDFLLFDMMLCWAILAAAMIVFADLFPKYVAGRDEGGGAGRAAALGGLVVVAALSTGQGLAVNVFVLAAGALALALRKPLPRGYAWLAALSAGLIAAYFVGYAKPPAHPPVTAALESPLLVAEYAAGLLGAPFAWRLRYAVFVGAAVAAVFAAAAAALVKRMGRDALWEVASRYPLIPMSAVLLGAILVGRVGFGAGQALASRYVAYTLLLVVPILLLALDLLGGGRARTALLALLVAAIVPVWYLGYREGLHEGWVRRNDLRTYRDCVLAQPYALEACDGKNVYPVPVTLRRRTALLRDHGLCFFAD